MLEREVRAALNADAATRPLATARLTVEPGGLSNHAWIADAEEGRYFVRLSPPNAARLGVDRSAECELLTVVASAGLAPAVVRCDPARRLLVTRHVAGRNLTRAQAVEPRHIDRLAAALRELHAIRAPRGLRRVDFATQARRLEAQCAGAQAVGADLRERAGVVFARLERGEVRDTLCHNDLHHLNLVDGERLWIVDWEYGGAGDPAFDFASFLCQHDCGPEARQRLLRSYGAGNAGDASRIDAACWAFDYVQWLWYGAWSAKGADPVYAERATAIERRLRDRPSG